MRKSSRQDSTPPSAPLPKRDRILNFLMLAAVALALGLTFAQDSAASPALSLSTAVPQTAAPSPSPSPAAAYRIRREQERTQEEISLRQLADSGASEETRAQAQVALLALQTNREAELTVEAALSGLGYDQALCTIQGETVHIILSQPLSDAQAAMLLALAQEASGAAAENIRIIAC